MARRHVEERTEPETPVEPVNPEPVVTPPEPPPKQNGNGFTPSAPVKVIGPLPCGEKGSTLRLAIFSREVEVDDDQNPGTKKKVTLYSCQLTKSYVTPEGEVKTTASLRTSEVPLAIIMYDNAHMWMTRS